MRYGVISDIHANVEALEAVLRRLELARVDRVICLGDIVGYHASPNECVRLVRDHCVHVIAGNHDRAALGTIAHTELNFMARRAVAWTTPRLAPDCVDFMRGLDIAASVDATTYIVHAGLAPEPNDRFHVKTPARIVANLAAAETLGAHICFFGHTHRAIVHSRERSETGLNIELDPTRGYLINPGSVGQSRDDDPRAACAIYDADAHRIELVRVDYDHAACRARAAAAGLLDPPGLARRGFEVARSHWYDAAELARRAWSAACE
jgi:predicted phosphodiesterase